MKLNNKGFAISSIMYLILVMVISLMILSLAISSSRKLILDKQKKEANALISNSIMSYREVLEELKRATQVYIQTETDSNDAEGSIEIAYLKNNNYTDIEDNILEYHNLSDKYMTFIKEDYDYRYYVSN